MKIRIARDLHQTETTSWPRTKFLAASPFVYEKTGTNRQADLAKLVATFESFWRDA
jgi:hypothetical protein